MDSVMKCEYSLTTMIKTTAKRFVFNDMFSYG